jgi:hypothetical protein
MRISSSHISGGFHRLCERREYAFNILLEYSIIFPIVISVIPKK